MDSLSTVIREALEDTAPHGGFYNEASDCESSYEGMENSGAVDNKNSNQSTEVLLREEILNKFSQNKMSRDEAYLSWMKSFGRDLKKIGKELDMVEIGLRGRKIAGKRKRQSEDEKISTN